MTPTVYFLHGRDSNPLSQKIQHLSVIAERYGWKVVVPDYSSIKDPDERVRMFLELARDDCSRSMIVGSSMGGYVAMVSSEQVRPSALLLLAPALDIEGYQVKDPEPVADETVIVHGWNDELIRPESVFSFADIHRVNLHLVNDDHVLTQSIPFIASLFEEMLNRCSPVSCRRSRVVAVL